MTDITELLDEHAALTHDVATEAVGGCGATAASGASTNGCRGKKAAIRRSVRSAKAPTGTDLGKPTLSRTPPRNSVRADRINPICG